MSDPTDLQARADRVKVGHLVAGIVFLGVAATWALRALGAIDGLQTGIVLPALLVAAGVIGLVAMVVQNRRSRARTRTREPDDNHDTHPLEEEQS